jgi:hypothetical protein
MAGSWSAHEELDGFIPSFMLKEWGGTPRLVRALVEAGLWIPADDGAQFRNWAEYQPTRAELEAIREKERERKRAYRAKQGDGGVPPGQPTGHHEGHQVASEDPDPTRPDPTLSSSTKKREPASRGSRLDPNWLPSKDSVIQMEAEAPDVDVRAEHRVFVDYWIAQPGQKGVKTNWESTWKNWMRRKQGDVKSPTPKLSKAAVNAAEYRRLFGNGSEGSVPALDAGISP